MITQALQEQLSEAQAKVTALHEELAQTNRGLVALTMELEQRVDQRTFELRNTQLELTKTNSDLMQLTLELEDRVNSRTRELETANETLRRSRLAALNLMEDAITARASVELVNAALQVEMKQRKNAEEAIRQLNVELEMRVNERTEQLRTANQELEAFSYSVSHDLRAPLRHVSGYVELLAKQVQSGLSEKGIHYLDSIADSAHQMGKLIDDLLQFSRTGRADLRRSQLEMNGIVREVVDSVSKDNPDRTIEWVVGVLPSVLGDDATLRLAWINLLSNAVKFTRTRAKASIEIGAKAGTKEVIYFVKDNGVGFDMKYAQKLFGVFQRLHSTEDFEGTGVGLANVRRIVTRHGGRTWAEAELNNGATFYFSIPHN
jgi:signal transduction histidine kinase